MLFYNSVGPNPKVVRMFMAERGISGIPTETIDLRGGENRREPFLSKNPSGQWSQTACEGDLKALPRHSAQCFHVNARGHRYGGN